MLHICEEIEWIISFDTSHARQSRNAEHFVSRVSHKDRQVVGLGLVEDPRYRFNICLDCIIVWYASRCSELENEFDRRACRDLVAGSECNGGDVGQRVVGGLRVSVRSRVDSHTLVHYANNISLHELEYQQSARWYPHSGTVLQCQRRRVLVHGVVRARELQNHGSIRVLKWKDTGTQFHLAGHIHLVVVSLHSKWVRFLRVVWVEEVVDSDCDILRSADACRWVYIHLDQLICGIIYGAYSWLHLIHRHERAHWWWCELSQEYLLGQVD